MKSAMARILFRHREQADMEFSQPQGRDAPAKAQVKRACIGAVAHRIATLAKAVLPFPCKYALALMPLLCCLYGCQESTPPPGTVARINGETISLHAVQALLDSRTQALGIPPRPSVAEMQTRYAQATGILLAHTLVRQELAARGLGVTDAELDAAVAKIKAEYGEAGLESFLAESLLREDEWRQLMRDHLSLEIFSRRVLDPAIRVEREEMRRWYGEHEADFAKPETWRVCLKQGETKASVESWCGQSFNGEVNEEGELCQSALPEEVPQPWQQEFRNFKPGRCGKIIESEGSWRTVALIRKEEAKTAKLSEVYPVVEAALLAEKRAAAFDAWLEQRLQQAKIEVMPGLFPVTPPESPLQ